jgi:hypothetical protein
VWKDAKLGLNVLFRGGAQVAKMVSHQMQLVYSIGTNMIFRSILQHFVNLPRVKRCKTCVWRSNALFWGTQVAKMVSYLLHSLYTIAPKMMFGRVLEHFGIFRNVKDAKPVFRAWMHYFGEPKLRKWFRTKCIISTPLDPRWCLGVFWSISERFGM